MFLSFSYAAPYCVKIPKYRARHVPEVVYNLPRGIMAAIRHHYTKCRSAVFVRCRRRHRHTCQQDETELKRGKI